MNFSTDKKSSYTAVMVRISVLTVLSAIGCVLFGYLLLPFAAGFYACLLLYENQSKRIFSYVIPIVMFTFNLLLNGLYSLEAFAYVVVGFIIFIACKKRLSKGEAVFWTTFALTGLILISAVILPFDLNGSVGAISIKQFYANLYGNYRSNFINLITSLTKTSSNGMVFFAYNAYEAEHLFNELVMSVIPLIVIVAFALSGFSFKIFSRFALKYYDDEYGIEEWDFRTSNTIAYFYIVISLMMILNTFDASIFDFTLNSLNTIFSAVFAYIGVKCLYRFMRARGRSAMFSIIVILILSTLLSSNAISLLSYLGVFVNIRVNKFSQIQKK